MGLLKAVNFNLLLVSLLLVSIGILVIYSSSRELAFQQFIYALVGLLFFLFILQIDLYTIKKIIFPLYFFSAILLVIVLIVGLETRGSVRWIPVGFFNIQPSEFAKPALILFLAFYWSKHLPSWINILKSLLWISPFLLLIFKQPDLGSTLTLIAIWIGILFASQVSIRKALILISIAAIVIPSSFFYLHDYQKQRIVSFISPNTDPLGRGYNLIQSTIAVGSGQVWGRGLGRGTQSRLQFLPEFRTDFIFASIAEEWGFLGSSMILLLYIYMLTFCLLSANNLDDKFSHLTAIGVFSMLLFQMFINIGMNIGILPITGITLPLISYGGSSLIVTMICLGLVSSVAKIKKRS